MCTCTLHVCMTMLSLVCCGIIVVSTLDVKFQAIVLVVGIGTWAATRGDNINRATQC